MLGLHVTTQDSALGRGRKETKRQPNAQAGSGFLVQLLLF
jgi:hypothetical protein